MSCNSIPVRKIQNILCTVNNEVVLLSLDSGCEGDCIRKDECVRLGLKINPLNNTDTTPTLADGNSNLSVIGKTKFTAVRDKVTMEFEGYVVEDLQAKILYGAPFLARNKIVQELHNNKIVVDNKFHILESSSFCPAQTSLLGVSNITAFKDESRTKDLEILKSIQIDPSVSKNDLDRLNMIHKNNIEVFNNDLTEGYNNASGDFTVRFNFLNNVPPKPNIGCVPSYNKRDDLVMQTKIDELERENHF